MPRTEDADLLLFHAPRTRAFSALWLLEELGVDYRVDSFALDSQRHKTPAYLALNPMGKVPLVIDRGIPVAEMGAIAIHLADTYRDEGAVLSPAIGDRDRPAFLRWTFFAGSVMEPGLGEVFFKWEVPSSSVAWGCFADMFSTLTEAVSPGPWLLGSSFTAADVVVGSTARFGQLFGAFPKSGPVKDYVDRLCSRPAFERASAIEAELGGATPE